MRILPFSLEIGEFSNLNDGEVSISSWFSWECAFWFLVEMVCVMSVNFCKLWP